MAWDPSDLNAVHAICDETENGIFEWPEAVLANLRADRWNNMNMQQKQLNMVGYLLEIFYDMALAPGDNVSENPIVWPMQQRHDAACTKSGRDNTMP